MTRETDALEAWGKVTTEMGKGDRYPMLKGAAIGFFLGRVIKNPFPNKNFEN